MRINAITQPLAAELRKAENAARKAEKELKRPAPVDSSEFSESAQTLSNTKAQFATISASLSAQPDVRIDKVTEVKQKIESGYYNSPEFIDKLADKLLNDFGMKSPSA